MIIYFLDIRRSKGGCNRIAPVISSKVDEIKDIFLKARKNGQNKLFSHISKEIDIHSFRRQYAQKLYTILNNDKALKDSYLTFYPLHHEKVKSSLCKDHRGNTFERDTVYVISQALGHSRIDTSIIFYLK